MRGIAYFLKGISLYISSFLLALEVEERPEKEKNKSFKIAGKINIASSYLVMIALFVASFVFGFLALGVLPSFLFHKAFPANYDYYFKSLMLGLMEICYKRFCDINITRWCYHQGGSCMQLIQVVTIQIFQYR